MSSETPSGTSATTAELGASVERLLDATKETRVAALVISPDADEAERRYAADVAAAVAQLECDLALAHVARAAGTAVTSADVGGPVNDLVDGVHTWFDDLAVQARLAQMDARDGSESVKRRIRRASDDARAAVGHTSDAVGKDLTELRTVVGHAGETVRQAVAEAAAAVRELAG